jgi:hypothetical protein
MNKNYNVLLERLNYRMNPDGIILNKSFSDELGSIPQKGIFLYIKKAMLGVEPEYTQKSIEAGMKVRDRLKDTLDNASFEFQGSVMTNTHIRGYSDIDLLTICEKFYTFDRNGISNTLNSFEKCLQLNSEQKSRLSDALSGGGYLFANSDLRQLRLDCERILKNAYTNTNIEKPKSIKIGLTSPKRDVDVVIANWYKNANFYINDDKKYLGIKVFVKGDEHYQDTELKPDFPFLSISRINEKDLMVNGRLKKMIRFLKTVKADSDNAEDFKLSSFDFNAICYDINPISYREKNYLDLVFVVYRQLEYLVNSNNLRNNLKSVDGNEFIFRNEDGTENAEKVESLRWMINEISVIIKDLYMESPNLRIAV